MYSIFTICISTGRLAGSRLQDVFPEKMFKGYKNARAEAGRAGEGGRPARVQVCKTSRGFSHEFQYKPVVCCDSRFIHTKVWLSD
jgi:hypothetical protein